jgi:hypothetical protein
MWKTESIDDQEAEGQLLALNRSSLHECNSKAGKKEQMRKRVHALTGKMPY